MWTHDGWVDRFGLDLPRDDSGYGHSPEDVAKVRAPAELLAGYYHAVHTLTLEYVASVTADDLARIVDDWWDPPVTASARVVSIIDDCASTWAKPPTCWASRTGELDSGRGRYNAVSMGLTVRVKCRVVRWLDTDHLVSGS